MVSITPTPVAQPPIIGNGQAVAVSTPLLNLTQTWDGVGVVFTGLFANFTDTTSAANSNLADIQLNGVSQFSIGKGFVSSHSTYYIGGGNDGAWTATSLNLKSTGVFSWSSTPNASVAGDTGFSRTAAGIAALGNGAQGDSSGRLLLTSLRTVPKTFATLPAAPVDGERSFITDSNSTVFAAAAAGGGANHVPVYFDGAAAAWKIG